MIDLWLSGVFFQALNTPKLIFGLGELTTLPQTSLWAGEGYGEGDTPPHSLSPRRLRRFDFGAFGASVVSPPNTNSSLHLW